jgi:hypothetical protein
MMIEADDDQDELSGESCPESARSHPADAATPHERLLIRVFRARMPYAMLSFLAITAAAAIPELSAHPERASTYAVVYALESQVWLVALTLIRSVGLSYPRAVVIALLTTIAMMALITGYHVAVSSDAAVLLVTLSYVTVGAMVVFPWQPQAQLVVAAASVIAYAVGLTAGVQTTASSGLELLGLATIAALTVGSVNAAEHYRRRFAQLASTVRAAGWQA